MNMRFPRSILRARLEKFQSFLKEKNIDAAMIRTLSSFVYFTGIKWLRPALLIPAEGEPIAFIAKGEEEGFLERTWIENIVAYSEGGEVMASVSGTIRKSRYRVVGLEFGVERDAYILFYEFFKRLNRNVKVVDISDIIYQMRMFKDDYELDAIRKAGEIASSAMKKMLETLDIGISETDIAAEGYRFLYKHGCEEPKVYVDAGPYPRVHSEPLRDNYVKENTFVTIIIGADYNHYYANISRTVYIGKPDKKARDALECMDAVYNLAFEKTHADVKPITIMRELEEVYKKYGMARYHVRGYLHGVGLKIEETPITTIVPNHRMIMLKPRMVIALVHAPIMISGIGQLKREDTFIIEDDGSLDKVT